MSDERRLEEEEEEEEDSEPVVILKGRKGSIKIVSDSQESSDQQQIQQQFHIEQKQQQHEQEEQEQPWSQSNSVTQFTFSPQPPKDLSQPVHVSITHHEADHAPSASPATPQRVSVQSPAQSVLSPSKTTPAMPQPAAQPAVVKQTASVVANQPSPQARVIPSQQEPPKPAQVQPLPKVSPQPVQAMQKPAQVKPAYQPTPTQQPVAQKAQITPEKASAQLSSPISEGEHPVLKQVPIKPAAPLVYPEQFVLHPAPAEQPMVSPPAVGIVDDFSWRQSAEENLAAAQKPERQRGRLGQVWPPQQEESVKDLGRIGAIRVQEPTSWVQQESVTDIHSVPVAPWAKKEVGRIGMQWPPPEDEISKEALPFKQTLRPQWPPVADGDTPSSQDYQKMALQQVHTQVGKQKIYFGSGGAIKPDEEDDARGYEAEQRSPQVISQVPRAQQAKSNFPAVPPKTQAPTTASRPQPQAQQQQQQQQRFQQAGGGQAGQVQGQQVVYQNGMPQSRPNFQRPAAFVR